MSLNEILLIGNVGGDPEMRYTPSGSAVTNFSLAVNYRRNRQDGEGQDETEWFRVAAWDRLAEQVNQYVVKGSKVFVNGRLRSRTYQGNDGQTRFVNEVNAFRVLFLDRPGRTGAPGAGDDYQPRSGARSGGQWSPPGEDAESVEDLPW